MRLCHIRAYVVPKNPALIKDPAFPAVVQEYVKGKVAYYKYLRGGKFSAPVLPTLTCSGFAN